MYLLDENRNGCILTTDGEHATQHKGDLILGKMNALSLLEQRVTEVTDDFFQQSDAVQEARRVEYRTELQPALLVAYGEDASCFKVDPWTAEAFSELHKDRYGFRPSNYSYKAMMEWMDNIPPFEDTNELVEDEDRFDPDIVEWFAVPTDDEEDQFMRLRDFEEVYGVSAMGQAMRFMDMRDY